MNRLTSWITLFAIVVFLGCEDQSSSVGTVISPPSSPSPASGATGVHTDVTLSWKCDIPPGDSYVYDIYFGTSSNVSIPLQSGQTATTLDCSTLKSSQTYYWRVVAKGEKGGNTSGPLWNFTTAPDVVIPGMVQISGGTFPANATTVTVSSFIIDVHEVTYELWTEVRDWGVLHGYSDLSAGRNGYNPVGSHNPATSVSWYEVLKWCNARSEKEGLTPVYYVDASQKDVYRGGVIDIKSEAVRWHANGFRLPTEAEWEFAARGGVAARGALFSGSNTAGDVAWYSVSSGFTTHPVREKQPNELGLYDMSGNAWEWCWDSYGPDYPAGGTIDPTGPSATLALRSMRGGSFLGDESYCRVSYRGSYGPQAGYFMIGFRCVRD